MISFFVATRRTILHYEPHECTFGFLNLACFQLERRLWFLLSPIPVCLMLFVRCMNYGPEILAINPIERLMLSYEQFASNIDVHTNI